MRNKVLIRVSICLVTVLSTISVMSTTAYAKEKTYTVNGEKIVFDAEYYANTYTDVKNALGTSEKKLLNHYVKYGRKEGRTPYARERVSYVKEQKLDTNIVEQNLLEEINTIRKSVGVGQLSLSSDLNKVAAVRVKEMSGFFSHTRPDGTDFTTAYTAVNSKYANSNIGENASITVSSGLNNAEIASSQVQIFKGSAEHYARMTSSEYKYIGISSYQIGDQNYVVLEFSNN